MSDELPSWVTETPKKFGTAWYAEQLKRLATRSIETDGDSGEGVRELEPEWLDANEKRRELARRQWVAPVIETAQVELDDTAIVNMCPCCNTSYTAKTFHALPFSGRGVKEFEDGDVVVTETYRNCGCGSTRMISTERRKS